MQVSRIASIASIVIRHDRPQFTESTSQQDILLINISLNNISLNDISLSDISLNDVSHNTFFTERRFQIQCKVYQHVAQIFQKYIYFIVCQCYEQKEHITVNKQRPGRPRKCRAFDAGLRNRQCLDKNVVYCLS